MRNINSNLGTSHSDIVKINLIDQGKYEVHFDFIECPVIMNETYLDLVVSELNQSLDFQSTNKIIN